jgi:prepilin-type N-terminal cleavage/methylation domain-containing protein
MRPRRGFSFVELLVTMIVIGLLARLAVPRYGEMKRRATAAAIVGDVHTIRVAAFSYYTEHGTFPSDAAMGQLPTELVANLPAGFSFSRPDYSYDWHVWSATNGSGNTETLVGITVSVSDQRLVARLVLLAGAGYIPIVTPTQVTFLVSSQS